MSFKVDIPQRYVYTDGVTINGKGTKTSPLVISSSGQDISGKEDKSNKVTSLSGSSTDTQYPSAKAVYDALGTGGGLTYSMVFSLVSLRV